MNFHPMEVNANTRVRWEAIKHIPILKDFRGKKILEIGAGLGFFSYKFSILGGKVIATDVDSQALEYLKRELNIETKVLNIETHPVPGKGFDLIFMGEILEHVKDPGAALKRGMDALVDDGKILFTTPALEGWLTNTPGKRLGHEDGSEKHERDGFYFSELNKILTNIGMSVLHHQYCVFSMAELFMQFTKLIFLMKKKTYAGQSDVLKACDSLQYRVLKLIFPLLLNIFLLDEMVCRFFHFSGHCHVILAGKNLVTNGK